MTTRKTRTGRLALESLETREVPATFTVTNAGDNGGSNPAAGAGTGTFRQAIIDANDNPNSGGPDRIEFNIPGSGVHTIQPDFDLPDIQDSVIIDGYTQPGSSPNTLAVGNNAVLQIEINGANAGEASGLVVFAPDSTIRGLIVNGFRQGTSSTQGRGIAVLGGATNAVIVGNFVGVNATGTAAVANENVGIFILTADGTLVGGADPADRNVVSGNGIRGIFANAANVQIKGNYVGTNAAGTSAIPNTFDGVFVAKNTGYQIGGTLAGEGNVIGGNGFSGITLNGVTDSFVQGNLIGVGADGTTPLGNGNIGLFISNQAATNTNNLIGGATLGAANTIAFSTTAGITMIDPGGSGDRFQQNRIFSNGGLGIDLGNDGVTANDAGDADTGANTLLNFPTISGAAAFGGQTQISGAITNGLPNTQFRIEFFNSAAPGTSGFGEGETFLAFTTVTTDASGNAPFVFNLGQALPIGSFVTATATNTATNDTSEFSAARAVTNNPPTISDITNKTTAGGLLGPIAFTVNDIDTPLNQLAISATSSSPALVADGNISFGGSGTGRKLFVLPTAGKTGTTTITVTVTDSSGLTATDTFNLTVTAPPPPAASDLFAVATGPGVPVQVKVFNANGALRFVLLPFAGFAGGATVATGDVTGDGTDDIVVGAGPGSPGGHVKVFDGATGAEIRSFLAFPGFPGGVFVGAGDVTGDRRADIVVSTGAGASHVKAFDGTSGALVRSFLAFGGFAGGASVRAGDVNGDGIADIVVGAGPGGPPHIKVFDGATLSLLASFLAGDPRGTGGVLVGVGDFVAGGLTDVVGSVNGVVRVFGFSKLGNSLLPFLEQDNIIPFGPGTVTGGASVRLGNGIVAILVGVRTPGLVPQVKIIDGTSNTFQSFFAFDPAFTGGVNVG
jgi:hypothetical protein